MEEKTIRVEETVWTKLTHIKLIEKKKIFNIFYKVRRQGGSTIFLRGL